MFSVDDYDVPVVGEALDGEGIASGERCYEISEQHEIGRPLELTEALSA